MHKPFSAVLLCLLSLSVLAQERFSFTQQINTPVFHGTDSLKNAWGGGLNYPNFSNIDLNGDGHLDLVAYDRSGYRVLPFINKIGNGDSVYRYQPEFANAFPLPKERGSFMLLRDYNCDGKEDIFFNDGNFIFVFENTSQNGVLSFAPVNNGNRIQSQYASGSITDLYIARTDLPAIDDVDGDGDIDILTFGNGGTRVEFHENIGNCGLQFAQTSTCWGDFKESGIYRSVNLLHCSGGGKKDGSGTPSAESVMHAGSAMLVQDLNADGIPDMLLSNVSFNNLSALYNGGSIDTAVMTAQDTLYPAPTPVDLYVFPAPYYADASFDGVSDLLVSSQNNATSGAPDVSSNHNGIWRYKNNGQENNPNFSLEETDFLQGEMIDFGTAATPRLVDINGDSLVDIIVAIADRYQSPGMATSQFYYYQNTGTAQQPEFTLQDTNFADILSYNLGKELTPAFGDLDKDGDLDMIVGAISGYFHEFENIGTASNAQYSLKTAILTNTDVGANAAPYLYDIDNNGTLDLFVGNEQGKVYFFKNTDSLSTNLSLVTSFFAAVDANQNILAGNARPAFFKSDSATVLMLGSTNSGVIQYDGIDTVAAQPPNLQGTLGQGDTVSRNFEQTPLGIEKRSGRNQILIRASELQQQGLQRGYIKSLGLNVTDRGGVSVDNGLTIKAKLTSDTVLTAFHSNFPTPYPVEDKYLAFGNGWNTVTFQEPFLWDGQSNIVIDICFRGNIPASSIHVAMSYTNYDSYATGDITGFNSLSSNGCVMPYKHNYKMRPDLRFQIVPAANQLPQNENPDLFTGFRTSPDFADLNADGYIDAVVGNMSGGLSLYFGKKYNVGLPEQNTWNTKASFELFPNPARNQVVIRQNTRTNDLFKWGALYNLSGQQLMTFNLNEAETSLNVNHLPAGLYLMVLRSEKNSATQRLLIEKD